MGILSLSTLIETNYIKRLLKDNKKTPQDIKMSAPNSNNNQASMIGGHAQYAKGYVEESVGNLTGSKEWQESGKKDAEAGIGEMKAANQNRTSEPAASGIGRVEELAGKAAGCEGMEKEGAERQAKAS